MLWVSLTGFGPQLHCLPSLDWAPDSMRPPFSRLYIDRSECIYITTLLGKLHWLYGWAGKLATLYGGWLASTRP